jgi:transposase-like protein
MICPSCFSSAVAVRDSRIVNGERQRRRVCGQCNARWFTREVVVERSLEVKAPEPAWWTEARSLRRQKLGPVAIARALNKSHSAVICALKPSQRQKTRRREAEYLAGPEGRDVYRIKKATQRARAQEARV